MHNLAKYYLYVFCHWFFLLYIYIFYYQLLSYRYYFVVPDGEIIYVGSYSHHSNSGEKQVSKEAQTKINKQIDKQIIKERKKEI